MLRLSFLLYWGLLRLSFCYICELTETDDTMNRFLALFVLGLLIVGCNDVDIDSQPPIPQAEVSIEINGLDTKSIDLTLSVRSADMKALDSWGIVYCETSNREQGKEKAAPGSPSDAGQQMSITGLKADTDYYIWGWVEDKESSERTWTADYTLARTKQETAPVKLTGTIIGTQYSVDYDNGNAKSTTVNTKNNVFDGNFDTYFASYDRSRTWVGLDLGKKDPQAKARLVELWDAALNEGKLKDLDSYMEDTAKLLDESQELNFKRWRILDQWVHMNYQALGSYEAELGTVRNHIKTRLNTLDELIKKQ